MNVDDLLNEMDDVLSSKPTRMSNAKTKTYPGRPTGVSTQRRTNNNASSSIDELLDIIGDTSSSVPQTASPCQDSIFHRSETRVDTSKSAGQGMRKKCLMLQVGGAKVKRGHTMSGLKNKSASATTVCSNLRCTECDFIVVQFPGFEWQSSVNYMFFRENVPNATKLKTKMNHNSDATAYACQCKWLSVLHEASKIDTKRIKWVCAGH